MPPELVDAIIAQIEDTTSLKSCSLTARTLVRSSQARLFRRIELLPPAPRSGTLCQRLYHTLTQSPHLASLVEDLHVVREHKALSWIVSDPTFPLVLDMLGLKSISLVENVADDVSDAEGDFGLHWGKVRPTLKSALLSVFSSPTLESVHLRGLVVQSPIELLSFFSESTSLRSLSISRIFFDFAWPTRAYDPWPESRPWQPQLGSLLISEVHCKEPLICHFMSPRIDLSHLTSLTIASEDEEWKEGMIKAKAFDRLEHLTVHHPEAIDLASCLSPSLRTLHVFGAWIHRTIQSTIQAVPVDSRLETITFEGIGYGFPLDADQTRLLNETINSALGRMSFLRIVQIKVHPWDGTFNDWQASVRLHLPSLASESRDLLVMQELGPDDGPEYFGFP